ncbi:MAG: glycosyltransferase [Caulobacteraceae bacterium]
MSEMGGVADISVVVVTYQSGTTLGRCLQALKDQSVQGFEVILSDNGSADGAARATASADPALVLIEKRRQSRFRRRQQPRRRARARPLAGAAEPGRLRRAGLHRRPAGGRRGPSGRALLHRAPADGGGPRAPRRPRRRHDRDRLPLPRRLWTGRTPAPCPSPRCSRPAARP